LQGGESTDLQRRAESIVHLATANLELNNNTSLYMAQ
jgi:hypothetical protein